MLLYIKDTLKCKELPLPTNIQFDCVSVEIFLSNEMTFILVCLYRQPTAKVEFYDQLKNLLKSYDQNKEIILIGDFNINWDDKQARKTLKRTTDCFNLEQLVEKPTRITSTSQSRIDLLFSNKRDRIAKTFNLLSGLSDHNIILFTPDR